MPYIGTKVYTDGSHYIAIPPEKFLSKKRKRRKPTTAKTVDTQKEKFETAYAESQKLPKRERKKFIAEQMKDNFKTAEQVNEFVTENIERKKINAFKRYSRLWRKVNLQGEWHYFVTFTYSNEKMTEQQFKKKLQNTLKHAVNRNGWKYIGI